MYVLSYRGPKFTEVAAVKVADNDEAQAVIASLPNDGSYCGLVVREAKDLDQTRSVLNTFYNALAEVPVKKFDNTEIARSRLFAVIERVAKPFDASSFPAAADEGATADNGSAPTDATASSDNTEDQETDMAAKKTKAKKAPKAKGERKPRKGSVNTDGKIKVLFDKNPRREGSALWKMYENLRDGMLVKTYLEKGGTLGSLAKGVKKKWLSITE